LGRAVRVGANGRYRHLPITTQGAQMDRVRESRIMPETARDSGPGRGN
jgi:hypothetical protein